MKISVIQSALFLLVFCVLVGAATEVFAQTTATLGEKAVGNVTCTNASNASDFDTVAQCNSITAAAGTMQKAPLFPGLVTAPPYASTACDSTKAGLLQYSSTYGMLGCDGTNWLSVKPTIPAIGTVMPDGTIYAGYGLYTTPCDYGATGTQGSCTGTPTKDVWTTMMSNCLALTSYGHNDWYMPSFDEVYNLYLNNAAIGGFSMITNYVSSSPNYISGNNYQWVVMFSTGAPGLVGIGSTVAGYVRCVRR